MPDPAYSGTGEIKMVDVGEKPIQKRTASASGSIRLAPSTLEMLARGGLKKGDALAAARIAGIQAAKKTWELIPLCHPIGLDVVDLHLELAEDRVIATSHVSCTGRTGTEMEALTAVAVALLTIYDMCKSVDTSMEIGPIRLLGKAKSDVRQG